MKIDIKKNRNIIMIAILVFIFLFDYTILLTPQARLLRKISKQVSTKSRDLKKAKADIASIGQFQSRSKLLREKMTPLAFRIPQEEEIPLIVENISHLANETRVKITSIRPMRESKQLFLSAETGKYYELPISIEAKSGYHQLGKFLNNLENNQMVMTVDGLELVPNPEDKLRHLAKLLIRTFVLGK